MKILLLSFLKQDTQSGFAFLSIIIAVALITLIGGSGTVIYQQQKHKAAEKVFSQNTNDSSVEDVNSPTLSEEPEKEVTEEPQATPTIVSSPKPKIQGVSTTQATTVPVATITKQPTPTPIKSTPTVTPKITPTPVITTSTPQPTNTVSAQEQIQKAQIVQKKAQLTDEINDASSQLSVISQRISELDSEIDRIDHTPGLAMTKINLIKAPLVAERNSLIDPYNALVKRRNELIEQLNLLNLL